MDEHYEIAYFDDSDQSALSVIGPGIHTFNVAHAGDTNHKRICFTLRDSGGEIVGGLVGSTYWGWFYVDLLWVREDLRGQGFGHRLLDAAEEEARQRGAANAYLDTFSFQAPAFYERQGYRVFGELPDFPAGHTRYFMTKAL